MNLSDFGIKEHGPYCYRPDSSSMIEVIGKYAVVAYLESDSDPQAPDTWDGEGTVLDYHGRHSDSSRAEAEEHLGYSDGSPDYSLVDEGELVERVHAWIREQQVAGSDEWTALLEYCDRYWGRDAQDIDDLTFVFRCLPDAGEILEAGYYNPTRHDYDYLTNVAEVQQALWEQGRADGSIGNRYCALLDVYDHSGIAYSLTGGGMQCRWDTSRGGALWVADASAKLEIDRRAEVYTAGEIVEGRLRTQNSYTIRYNDGTTSGSFAQWSDAFENLRRTAETLQASDEQKAVGFSRALREVARQCVETWNQYVSGDVWGCVVQVYENVAVDEDDDPEWEEVSEGWAQESCWGFYGSDYAKEELRTEFFEPMVKRAREFAFAEANCEMGM